MTVANGKPGPGEDEALEQLKARFYRAIKDPQDFAQTQYEQVPENKPTG